jgi:hypothetical protein
MNLRSPDLPVTTNERRSKCERSGGHNSIRQVRNLNAAHPFESIGDRAVERR